MSETYKSPVICPKCNTVRPSDATVPDWQCPSCGIAYVKAGGSYTPASDAKVVYHTRAPQERRGTLKFLLLTFGICAAGAWVWRKQNRAAAPASEFASSKPAGPREVVMFATSWCGYCAAARRFFADHGIKYVEYDIERDPEGARKYEKLGLKGTGVPVILIDGEIHHGYNERTLRAALVG